MRLTRTRLNYRTVVAFVVTIVVLACAQRALQRVSAAQTRGGQQAGMYEVDRLWPKPLPNHWILGSTVGLAWIRATMSGSSTVARPRSIRSSAA